MDGQEYRERDRQETRRGLKRYGLATAFMVIGIIFVSAGMPGHFLWQWVGIPLVALFACAFTPLLFHAARFLWDWLDTKFGIH